jgi:hypothetical protein
MIEIPAEQLVKKGKMTREPWNMTQAERGEWELLMQAEAKAHLFSIGQPLVYEKLGQMIAEYANGEITVLH